MKKDGDHWWITLDGLSANRQYDFQYLVDGEIRTSDPFAHKIRSPQDDGISQDIYPGLEPYPGDQTENLVSVIRPGQEAPSFTYPDFQPPEREELVIYELLVRDFLEESSYRVLADTLDYLDSLGVNAVELMPVSNFGGNNSWGYNPNAHLALDKAYGTPAGFRQFVEEAHRRDIAVIMDVVYNHITDQSPLVQLYGVTAENPFLETEPDRGICGVFFRELNQGSTFIKNYIDRANRYWIENFNVDGFRYDLAKCVADDGVNINDGQHSAAVEDGWKRVADRVWTEVDPNTLMILEFFGGSDVENALGSYGGDGNTAGMMTWHNMNQPYSQADMGYTQGGDISSDFTDAYYGNRSGYDQPSFIAYMESHDEQWLMRRKKAFGNASDDYSTQELPTALERQKLAGAFYFTLPGPRMMWQFGELGYGWGEDECLQEDSGSGGACSSSDPGRTAPKPVRWEYRDPEQHPGRVKLYEAWSALINLRNSEEVFTSLQTGVNMKAGNGDVGRRIVLQHESMDAVVFGNFGVRPQDVNPQFPTSGTWYDFFTGTAVNINADETSTPVPLAPGEFHVFTSEPVPTPDSGLVPFPSVAPPPEPPSNLRSQTGEEEIALSWSGSPSSDLTGYALYRGTAADFDTTGQQIARLPSGTTSYKDRSAEAGTTYYYRLVALDADGERSVLTTAAAAVLYPQRVGFRVERSFARGERPQDYRLVALPGQIDRTLAQTLPGSAGEAWQAYWDDGTETDFLVQFDGSDTFRFRPGRGFWLISDSTWSVQAEVESVSLQEGNTTTIDLHDGWNIIANPFDQGVAWSEVQAANDGSLQPIWAFNGSFRRETRFQSARRGEAFYFRNDGGLDRLVVPYGATDLQQRSPQKRLERPRPSILRLRAEQAGRASVVRLGLSRDAKPDVDALDWVAPPSRFSALSLRSVRGASVTGRQQVLARDVRTPTEEGVTFDLRLATAEQSPVTISAKSLSAIDAQAVRLVNAGTDRVYDLRRQKTVTVRPSDANTPLTLVAGTEAYVQDQQDRLTASELKLDSGYPNPFRQQTTISYTLPEEGVVTLEIFDVLGRRVRTLVDERKEAGPHTVVWRGGNEAGQSVSSGVYLGRLSFDGKTRTQKLVVVK
jgi:glycosidase